VGGEVQTIHITIISIWGDFSRLKNKFIAKFGHHTVIVKYGGHYGATKGPHQYLKEIGTLNWMILFKSLIVDAICNRCTILNYSHHSWHGKVCSNIWKVVNR
jgi:hypothetical protein